MARCPRSGGLAVMGAAGQALSAEGRARGFGGMRERWRWRGMAVVGRALAAAGRALAVAGQALAG